ncbi:uncharacterized protein LOC115625896 [Scaptodrosophila lebanonensis]|uniref:Uncharacterized protein LOC115625896 n=1 Tax=Drosophila lebanonensis TaxID=7225 RepID=A0A6J2TLR2_DROLE|nr:uncharacterized protein LOC115625896 [Scaptodrosophila lebanonensis]
MRRRELQTITIKLSELKEYEQAKLERVLARQQQMTPHTPTSDSDVQPSSSVPTILLEGAGATTPKPSSSST